MTVSHSSLSPHLNPQDASQLSDSLPHPHLGLAPVHPRHADLEGCRRALRLRNDSRNIQHAVIATGEKPKKVLYPPSNRSDRNVLSAKLSARQSLMLKNTADATRPALVQQFSRISSNRASSARLTRSLRIISLRFSL